MDDVAAFIASGVLEMYVLGLTSEAENAAVQKMIAQYPQLSIEIDEITNALASYGSETTEAPDVTIKPFLMAVADYTERLRNGEEAIMPPLLHGQSTAADYAEWINRDDMTLPGNFDGFYAKILGYTPQLTMAIAWLAQGAPEETHAQELESFLILEGTCDIVIEETVHSLKAGDYLSIPLHQQHYVRVTSDVPCKLILQRMAA